MASESLVGLPCSSGEEDAEEEIIENTQEPVSKKRGKGKEYHFFASFDTLKQAEDSLKRRKIVDKSRNKKKTSNNWCISTILSVL